MKRIAALALIAALGATSVSAEEIKPVTSSQASLGLLGLGGGVAAGTIIAGIVATVVVINAVVNDNSGT
jgi:hypothetical protein